MICQGRALCGAIARGCHAVIAGDRLAAVSEGDDACAVPHQEKRTTSRFWRARLREETHQPRRKSGLTPAEQGHDRPHRPRASPRCAGRSWPTISAGTSSGLVSQRSRSCPVAARRVSAAAIATKTTVARRATRHLPGLRRKPTRQHTVPSSFSIAAERMRRIRDDLAEQVWRRPSDGHGAKPVVGDDRYARIPANMYATTGPPPIRWRRTRMVILCAAWPARARRLPGAARAAGGVAGELPGGVEGRPGRRAGMVQTVLQGPEGLGG
jgi:hypothetical protein